MKVGTLVAGAVTVVISGAGGWFLRSVVAPARGESEHEEETGAPPPAEMSVEVATEPARHGDLTTTLAAFGVVRAVEGDIVSVSSRAGGRVAAVLARSGAEVEAGTPLFRLETAPLEVGLAQAHATAAAAENALAAFDRTGRSRKSADLESAVADARLSMTVVARQAERTTALRKDGLSSERANAEADQAAERARRELAAAERALEAWRTADADIERSSLVAARDAAVAAERDATAVLAAAEVRAPAGGRLASVAVRPGQRTEPGAELATILVGGRREVAFEVTPAQRALVTGHARATWTEPDGSAGTGTVRAASTLVDATLGLQEILVVPDDGLPTSPPGTVVRGEIDLQRIGDAVLVPTRALVRSGGAVSLVLVVEGAAKPVPVEILGRRGGLSAVRGEVKADDLVVVDGGYNLPAGARVRPAAATEGDGEASPKGERK